MPSSQKHIKVSYTTVYDTEGIYVQANMLKQTKNFYTYSLMAHKLAALRPFTFKETGEMRDAKTKSNLKNAVRVEVSDRVF